MAPKSPNPPESQHALPFAVRPAAGPRLETAQPPAGGTAGDAPLDRFATLLGRAPTDAEKLELVRVKEALDLDNNDALWLLIMGLDHLRGRFEHAIDHQRRQFEQSIGRQRNEFEASIDRRLAAVEAATGGLVESAKAQFLRDFPVALKQAARRVSLKALGLSGPVVLSGPVAGVALVLAGLGVVGAGLLAYELGQRAGYEQGVRVQRAEVAPAPKPPPAAKGR